MGSSSSTSSYGGGDQFDTEPEPGDLIEIFRESYQHWAVYVGGSFVVHFVVGNLGSSSASVQTAGGSVLKQKLWDVVGRDKWRVNNRLDKEYHPYPADVIVKKANAKVGEALQYNLTSYNCEHFANELRYGVAKSLQVQTAAEAGVAVGGIGLIGSLAVVGSMASRAGPSSA